MEGISQIYHYWNSSTSIKMAALYYRQLQPNSIGFLSYVAINIYTLYYLYPRWVETITTRQHQIPYTGNIWRGKILVNHEGKSYWWGKFWWISNSQCIYHMHFPCIREYLRGKFWRMAHNSRSPILSPTKIFSCIIIPNRYDSEISKFIRACYVAYGDATRLIQWSKVLWLALYIVHTPTYRFKVYHVFLLTVMFPLEITLLPAACNVTYYKLSCDAVKRGLTYVTGYHPLLLWLIEYPEEHSSCPSYPTATLID